MLSHVFVFLLLLFNCSAILLFRVVLFNIIVVGYIVDHYCLTVQLFVILFFFHFIMAGYFVNHYCFTILLFCCYMLCCLMLFCYCVVSCYYSWLFCSPLLYNLLAILLSHIVSLHIDFSYIFIDF